MISYKHVYYSTILVIGALKYEKAICERAAKLHPQIIIAALIDEKGQPVNWYVREGAPVPDEERSANMALQAMMVMSITKTAADYLGELEYLHTKMARVDIIHFPAFEDCIMVVVLERPFDEDMIVEKIRGLLNFV